VGDHLWWTRIFGVAFFLFEDLLFECVLLFEELFLLMGYFVDGDTHFCGGHAFSWGHFWDLQIYVHLSRGRQPVLSSL
jgi:hypothetical protein